MILQKAIGVHKGPPTQILLQVQGFTMNVAIFITKEMTLCILLSIGHLYPVDILAGNPEVIQEAAEAYYEKLLQQASSSPEFFSIPGGEKVKLEDSCVCFLPVYREDPKFKILVLIDPQAKERVLAIYLNQSWWPIEDIVKTADSSREGLIQVQTSGERIVLFVLNSIIFGMLERSSANDTFFVSHSAKESAKIFWRNGDAVAFYTVKMKGSLCDVNTSQCYLLPVLDTVFVRRKYRRCGLGMKILHDFCQSFVTEDALGISCPISADMYQECVWNTDKTKISHESYTFTSATSVVSVSSSCFRISSLTPFARNSCRPIQRSRIDCGRWKHQGTGASVLISG
ncbi:protein FAM169B-like isoform X3 [Malaclemys terrapin pileata]|uniref:protein FAM169B-like isoform X3 n=1 Tax=Malaclemys terrapin pileata TaxID=2991368 RepID=UPI0023A86608|nr:protein FAM169B-like isoform X3 [Malaclemys terrapin pileata]